MIRTWSTKDGKEVAQFTGHAGESAAATHTCDRPCEHQQVVHGHVYGSHMPPQLQWNALLIGHLNGHGALLENVHCTCCVQTVHMALMSTCLSGRQQRNPEPSCRQRRNLLQLEPFVICALPCCSSLTRPLCPAGVPAVAQWAPRRLLLSTACDALSMWVPNIQHAAATAPAAPQQVPYRQPQPVPQPPFQQQHHLAKAAAY